MSKDSTKCISKFQVFLFVCCLRILQADNKTVKCKGPEYSILKKKNEVRGLKLPNFKPYYKAVVMKTMWYWHTDK